jgi:O-antigen/teichoic acid export membrane protein
LIFNSKNNLSTYIKDILTSLTGTTLSQFITIAMAPILTRIYQPADYGLLGIYMSITSLLFVFVNFQYSQAILLTENKEEEDNIVALCYIITITFSLLVSISILTFYLSEVRFFTHAKLGYWLFFIPISIFLNGSNTIISKILNKYKKYKGLSISQIVASITTVSCSLCLGLTYKSYEGLFVGFLMGQFSRFFILYLYSRELKLKRGHINKTSILNGIKKYKKFPIFSIPTEFLYGWTDQLPIYFFNAYASTTVIGHFNYGKRMVSLPISLVTGAVGRVFSQRAAEQYNETGECKKIFVDTLKMLALPILPFFIVLGIFAPAIFDFVFGNEWRTAGEYVLYLIPMFYLKAVVSPLSYMYIIKHKQDEDMILHIVSFVLVASSFYLGYVLKSEVSTILSFFSFSYCLIYIYTLIRSYQFSK